jgi:hypothetical protein
MDQHTSEPWRVAHDVAVVVAGEGEGFVGVADCRTVDVTKGVAMANARLIAAAPDLLDALEELLWADPMSPRYQGKIDKADAAIRKAKGE